MNPALRGLAAVGMATAGQALSAELPAISAFFDFFLLVTVYYSVTTRQVRGMLMGAGCGLVQDALFAPILGLNAFSKALLGYWIGSLGARVLLHQPLPRLLVLAVATPVHALVVFALHLVLGLSADLPALGTLVGAAAGNVLMGALLYGAVGRLARRRR